jgi:hypothetical protein
LIKKYFTKDELCTLLTANFTQSYLTILRYGTSLPSIQTLNNSCHPLCLRHYNCITKIIQLFILTLTCIGLPIEQPQIKY